MNSPTQSVTPAAGAFEIVGNWPDRALLRSIPRLLGVCRGLYNTYMGHGALVGCTNPVPVGDHFVPAPGEKSRHRAADGLFQDRIRGTGIGFGTPSLVAGRSRGRRPARTARVQAPSRPSLSACSAAHRNGTHLHGKRMPGSDRGTRQTEGAYRATHSPGSAI